jgi:SAM-dependent methyltransferase
MANINDHYFDGHYKDIWKTIIPAELTSKEIDFMIPYFNLREGSRVLDLMCGYGRHALALGRKGIAVQAVDNLGEYVSEIQAIIAGENLPVTVAQQDVLRFHGNETADLAICMGNSLNFFNAADTVLLFKNISGQLKPGGQLLINTWSIAEIAFKNLKENTWSDINGFKYLVDSKLVFQPTRMEFSHIIIAPDGSTETKTGVDYIFSLNEMEAMLQQAGFTLQVVYSIPGRKKFTVGEPRAYIVAQKK